MASSDLSKQTGQLGVAPTTYVCPKLAGSVASGVVFLGVLVLMLIPRPDHDSPVVDEAALNTSPQPEIALTAPGPRNDAPTSITPRAPLIPNAGEPNPEQTPPAEQSPAEPEPTSPTEETPSPEEDPTPEPAEVKPPVERENVILVLEGELARTRSGDEFILRDTEKGSVTIKLAAVVAPPAGTERMAANDAARSMLVGPISVQCIENVRGKIWIGWVYAQGVEVNEAMIAQGFAWYDPRTVKSAELKALQEQARTARLGIWEDEETEPIYPEELQAIGADEEEVKETTVPAAADDTDTKDASTEVASAMSPAESESKPEAGASEASESLPASPPPDKTSSPVVVDQSSPEQLITSFTAALQKNDLDTARSLLSARTWGRASIFKEGRLSPSGIEDLRMAFDGATIQTVGQLPRGWNVQMETSTGKKMQVLVEQDGDDWVIYSWDVPR